MARSRPLFNFWPVVGPFSKKKKQKGKKKKKKKWIILFSISGSSQRSSVYIIGCHHLPLASLLSPLATSVSLHHRPPFSILILRGHYLF